MHNKAKKNVVVVVVAVVGALWLPSRIPPDLGVATLYTRQSSLFFFLPL